MKLGFIGAGEMGGAILRGILKQGWPKKDILVSVHSQESAKRIQQELGIEALVNNSKVIVEADWIFIAVKPLQVEIVLKEIAQASGLAKPVISMALGWTVEKIQKHLPLWPIIRIMPNTPLALGQGVTLFHFAKETPKRIRREVMALFDGMGKTFEISLNQFDAATALSGSGPAFVYYFMNALVEASYKLGLPRSQATELAVQTIKGACAMVEKEKISPAELAKKVATPGGCTASGMDTMVQSDFNVIMEQTLEATTKRAQEYSK